MDSKLLELNTSSLFPNNSFEEIKCYFSSLYETNDSISNEKSCNTTWDRLSCWPKTPANTYAYVPCFNELNGVEYDTKENSTRFCMPSGDWAPKSDYSRCLPVVHEDENFQGLWDVKEAATIYYIGYGLSLVALIIALAIFSRFNDLRCLRNTIHTNLMITYLLNDITWITVATLQSLPSPEANRVACFLVILLTYLMGTNFFWMFVEGLYLYILVVRTFSMEVVKFYVYALIGWGIPGIVVFTWALVKTLMEHSGDQAEQPAGCLWQAKDNYDYIFICPVLLVLMLNIFFLTKIMWVLITKLRAATSVESKQYRKASKALLVLIPLLGITYLVVLVTPSHGTARIIFTYLQAILLSTQGFTVAVFYCFLNAEVRHSVMHHFEQWKSQRSLKGRNYRAVGDGSRICSGRGVRDRASFTTTTTWVSSHKSPNGVEQSAI